MSDKERNIGDIMDDFLKAGEESIKDAEETAISSGSAGEGEKEKTEEKNYIIPENSVEVSLRVATKEEIEEEIKAERKAKESEKGENPMEEKFKELEQKLGQREKDKDALLKKAEEFGIAVERYNRLQNIFKTNIDPVYSGEKDYLINLLSNADKALQDKYLSDFNYYLDGIEIEINNILRKIEEEKQAKEAEKEINKEAEKLPEEERQEFLRKIANAGWFLKEQKAKAMKLVLNVVAEDFIFLSRGGRRINEIQGKVERETKNVSNLIQNLKKEGKTKREIDEILKERFKNREEKHYNEHILEIKQKEAGKIYRFLNAYSKKVYEKEEKLASRKRKQAKMGGLQKVSGIGQLFGNTARAGRMFYDFGRSLNPLKSITAASLFMGRFAEAAKEARLMNTGIKNRTRIGREDEETHRKNDEDKWDNEFSKAYEEALMIQEEAKKAGKIDANGNFKLSEEMYENAYKKFVNFDVLKRLGAYDEIVKELAREAKAEFETETDSVKKIDLQARIQFLRNIESSKITNKEQLDILLSRAFLDNVITEREKAFLSQAFENYQYCALNTKNFSQRAAIWSIKKQSLALHERIVNIDLDEKLTVEQKKLKQEFYFQMFESYLKDVDRMVDQAGMVDLLSYTARLTEKTAKAFSVAMIVDTVWKLWEGGLDIFSRGGRISAPSVSPEEAPVKVPEKQETLPVPKEKGIEKKEEETSFFDRLKEYFPGTGIKKKAPPEIPSETPHEETTPKIPKEDLKEMDQFLNQKEKELKEMDEFLKQQEEELSKKEERGSFKIPLIQTEEAFADYKSRFDQLDTKTKKEVIEILKKLPETEKRRVWIKGFEGAKGQDGILNYALDRKARNRFDNFYNLALKLVKTGNLFGKKVVDMFNVQSNEDTALNILKGKNSFHRKIGEAGFREYINDYVKRAEAGKTQLAPPPDAEAPSAPEKESAEKITEQKTKELERKKKELRESPEKERVKPREKLSAPVERRKEELIPRPKQGTESLISAPRRYAAVIEEKGSLWNAMMAMNLKDKTFNKAWADAEIYVDGQKTNYKAHEMGLVDPKTKVIYNEKTNTIHIIPPHGGEVGNNAALYDRFQKKGVETPNWLKKELDIKEGKTPELLEEAPSEIEEKPKLEEKPVSSPEEKFETEKQEKGKKEEKASELEESLKKIEELSDKTGIQKEDIKSIAENLKIKPEKLEQSFLEIVKSDEKVFKTRENIWIAERLEFFHNHSEIRLEDAQEIFENTETINKNLETSFNPQEIYSRFLGHKIKILDDSARERVIIKTSEHEFNIYKNKAEIDQRIFKSLFAPDEYISIEINPEEISADYLNDIFKRITEKSKRETALFGFVEERLKIDRDDEGKIIGEEDNKTFDWLYKIFKTADLKTVLDENWPKKFRGAIPVFKSKEEKSAETLREFFIEYLKKNKNIALEDIDYKKPCGEVLTKYVEKLTTLEEPKFNPRA